MRSRRDSGCITEPAALFVRFIFAAALLGLGSDVAAADRLVVLGGETVEGEVQAIAADGRITLTGTETAPLLGELRRIERAASVMDDKKPPVVVHLAGGGSLHGSRVTVRDETCTLAWIGDQEVAVPLDLVRAIRFPAAIATKLSPQAATAFEEAIAKPDADSDTLLVIAGDQVQSVSGVLDEVGAGRIQFLWEGKPQAVDLPKAYGLVVAAIGEPPDRSGQALVTLADGSSVWAGIAEMSEGRLHLNVTADLKLQVPWNSVSSIAINNDRLVYLSDLAPLEAEHQPLVTFPQPHRMDASVSGTPLVIGGKTFEKGIGTHSRSRLTFNNEGFDLLAATVGLDDAAAGKGDCEFVVLIDGQEALRQRARGGEQPHELQVRVSGAKQIALVVEAGEDLDLADHANWCDARLIRQPKPAASATPPGDRS